MTLNKETILNGLAVLVILSGTITSAGAAESEQFSLKRAAVGTQEIHVQHGLHLDQDCQPRLPIRVGIITPPRNGRITERDIELHSNYAKDTQYAACNEKKSRAVAAYYRANENYKGPDSFEIIIVFYDGTSRRYKVDMTIW